MYLKSIELYGFKSFADRTKIEFNDNITCIVGPNGSGKSNITDAIRWALGEQSSSALRGSKMLDVIFSGTTSRRSLGMAEVILTFDNSSNTLDIDYSEVEIKRKLYKNGESEYFINNNSCRLKDVRELFMDTGIGRDGYSIISQGKIDEILSSKPIERRVIFEEASGISKYKSQKNEVERKLKRTNENLIRISDLLIEIKSQRDTLKEEAKVAHKYKELYDKIKESEISKTYEEIRNNQLADSDLIKEHDSLNSEKESVTQNISKLNLEYENIKESLDKVELEISELQGQNIENIRKEKDLTNQFNLNKEKIESRKEDIIELSTRLDLKKEDLENINGELAEEKNKLDNYTKEQDVYLSSLKNCEENLEDLNLKLSKLEEQLLEFQKDISIKEENISKNQIHKNTLISLNEERKESLSKFDSQFERLENNNKELVNSLNTINNSIVSIESEIEKTNNSINSDFKLKQDIQDRIKSLNKKRVDNLEYLNSKSTRLNTLINMEQSYEGYNKSIRDFFRIINKREIKIPELHDTVANLIKVDEKYEKAITTALGGNTQNLVVDTFSSAQKIIEFLKSEKLGRITFLPMDNIKTFRKKSVISQTGFINYASNLIKYDEKYNTVFEFLLGNIAIVTDLDSGRKIANTTGNSMRIVTLDGDIINPGGSVSGGFLNTTGSIFNRKNELDRLKKEVTVHKNSINDLEKSIETEELSIKELEGTLDERKENLTKLQAELSRHNSKKIEIQLSNENNLNNIEEYQSQVENYNKQINETEELIMKLEKEGEDLSLEIENLVSKKSEIINSISKMEKEKNESIEIINKKNLNLANVESELGFTNRTVARLKDEVKKTKVEISQLLNDKERYTQEIESLQSDNEISERILKELVEINSNYESNNRNITQKRKSILDSYNTISADINDNKGKLLELEKQIYFISTKLENSKAKNETLISDIQENYYYTLEPNIIILENYKTKISKSSIKSMKQEISNLGVVNLSAIVSYKEAEERYTFTKNQHEDLVETEKSLKKLLKNIELTMEEKFNESFKEINRNFNRIFKYLFNGGKAELAMEDSDSFEEAGVDIIAQLPGKKRQLLDAMSGGERSLTTVALLFALLETRPAPFCLLDEIDAALDESNIKRFLSYLTNLSHIQFAIITHRKTTMTAADYLYGITMEEPGVSKVVSLKFGGRKEKNVQMA